MKLKVINLYHNNNCVGDLSLCLESKLVMTSRNGIFCVVVNECRFNREVSIILRLTVRN